MLSLTIATQGAVSLSRSLNSRPSHERDAQRLEKVRGNRVGDDAHAFVFSRLIASDRDIANVTAAAHSHRDITSERRGVHPGQRTQPFQQGTLKGQALLLESIQRAPSR